MSKLLINGLTNVEVDYLGVGTISQAKFRSSGTSILIEVLSTCIGICIDQSDPSRPYKSVNLSLNKKEATDLIGILSNMCNQLPVQEQPYTGLTDLEIQNVHPRIKSVKFSATGGCRLSAHIDRCSDDHKLVINSGLDDSNSSTSSYNEQGVLGLIEILSLMHKELTSW